MATPSYTQFRSIAEYEEYAQKLARDDLHAYEFVERLEEVYKHDGAMLQELWLASEWKKRVNFAIRITNLHDLQTLQTVSHEVKVLQDLGLHKRIMGAFAVFHVNKSYVACVLPAYTPIRNRTAARYRYKNEGEDEELSFASADAIWNSNPKIFDAIKEELRQMPGVSSRNSVAFVLRKVIKGLKYLHSKGYVHTQLSIADVYMDEHGCVKLSGFGHCQYVGSKNWKFTGNANYFAPEACLPDDGNRTIEPSFDVFGLGLLTLELISGRRSTLNNDQARKYLKNLLDRVEERPSLKEYDPSCYRNGNCIYDSDVENFLNNVLAIQPKDRASLDQAYKHPFLSRKVDKVKAVEMWKTCKKPLKATESQSLLHEMQSQTAQGRDNEVECESLEGSRQQARG